MIRTSRSISITYISKMFSARRLTIFLVICVSSIFSSGLTVAQTESAKSYDDQSETMPAFKGDLSSFFSKNLRYPDSAVARKQEGRAFVEFVVAETGLIRDIKIKKSSGFELLDQEAMRLLRLMQFMPHWKPGTQKGVPVPVAFTLPVTFRLN